MTSPIGIYKHIKDRKASFVPIGDVSAKVCFELMARRGVRATLKASIAQLEEAKRLEVERGKALITKGLTLIQQNASPEATVQYLRDTLAAIEGK